MAMVLSKLMNKVEHMDITLIAGEGGLANIVTWVHMAETVEASDFLDGSQLAITTGIGLKSRDEIISLLKAFYEKNVAGVIINLGPFIEEVPEEARQFCDENNLPLYVVPWKEHLAEIMHICCYVLTKEEQRMLETSAAFKNAIFFPKQEELYVVPLSQRSFRVKWNYSITVMKIRTPAKNKEKRTDALCWTIEKMIKHDNKNFAVFVNEMEIILIFANITEDELLEEVKKVQINVKRLLNEGEKLYMGVGRLTKSVRCIYKSYNQAKSIQRLQARGKIQDDKIFYTSLGIYRLLMGIEDREIMKEYYSNTLKPLTDYDAVNSTDLCSTLR